MCGVKGLDSLEQELLPAARAAVRRRAEAAVVEGGGAKLGALAVIDAGSFSASGVNEPSLVTCEHGTEAEASVTATFWVE